MDVCETFSEHRVPFVLNSTPRYKTSHSGDSAGMGLFLGGGLSGRLCRVSNGLWPVSTQLQKLSVLGYSEHTSMTQTTQKPSVSAEMEKKRALYTRTLRTACVQKSPPWCCGGCHGVTGLIIYEADTVHLIKETSNSIFPNKINDSRTNLSLRDQFSNSSNAYIMLHDNVHYVLEMIQL